MPLAFSFAVQVLSQLPALIAAGIDVVDLIKSTNSSLQKMKDENREPTDQEWDDLNSMIESMRNQRPDVSGE